MDLSLHRVADPRFVAIDCQSELLGSRRLVCEHDVSPEEIHAQWALEVGQRERLVRHFEVESEWRSTHRTTGEPKVGFSFGTRADLCVRADGTWRRSPASPPVAIVHVIADASGVDEDHLRWLLCEDEPSAVLFLVAAPSTARHVPASIDDRGAPVEVRVFPWIRERVDGRFDPLAMEVWFELAGPSGALRRRLKALPPIRFAPK